MSVGILVPGVLGRMGRLIASAALDDERHSLLGVSVRPNHPHLGDDLGAHLHRGPVGLSLTDELSDAEESDKAHAACGRSVMIDFSVPEMCAHHAMQAQDQGWALLVGTTGLDAKAQSALDMAAREVPVLLASNTSLGANLLIALTAQAARAIPDADVEIVELHHRHKKDAPSGTAISLAQAAAEARDQSFENSKRFERAGLAPRESGEIGVFGVRGGDVAGEHTVHLFLDGERIELTHRVSDRRIFALGALAAARFLADRAPGHYSMRDVLGL